MRDSKRIGNAVEEILDLMNTIEPNVVDDHESSVDFIKLACLCYSLMWSIGSDPPNKGLVCELVGFDLDMLADQGESISKEFDDIADIASMERLRRFSQF